MEIRNLPDAEFKTLVIRMIKKLIDGKDVKGRNEEHPK